MIFIQENTDNTFITRFNDKISLTTGYYLWELENEFSKEIVYFMLDDTSEYQSAYNKFTLTENTTGSTSGGINVPLSLVGGQYNYKVYESTEQSLELSAVTGTYIESDILFVEIEETVNTSNSKLNDIYY